MSESSGFSGTEDIIRINDLVLTIALRTGARWPKPPSQSTVQQVLVTIAVFHDIQQTAITDDLSHSINYSLLASSLRAAADSHEPFNNLEDLCYRSLDVLYGCGLGIQRLNLTVNQSRPPLHCQTVGIEVQSERGGPSSWIVRRVKHLCIGLHCNLIVGINDCEREETQPVLIDLTIDTPTSFFESRHSVDFRVLTRQIYEVSIGSSYQTLEALASLAAQSSLAFLQGFFKTESWRITVKAAKPYALTMASSSQIEIQRSPSDYQGVSNQPFLLLSEKKDNGPLSKAAISLGSNIGDLPLNIERALRLLEDDGELIDGLQPIVNVIDTSFLYQTTPMYVSDQAKFLNCACIVQTNLSPTQLLNKLKRIEKLVGRELTFRNGPRTVDLDIALYDDVILDTREMSSDDLEGQLVIPHPRMCEREFVLRPLNDMIPDFVHPIKKLSIRALLRSVPSDPQMRKVIPFPNIISVPGAPSEPKNVPETLVTWKYSAESCALETHVMATLNVTPDSFSDGSEHITLSSAMQYVENAVSAGSDILDVGGYSTRPNAAFVSEQDEIDRVVPVIEAIRQSNIANGTVISVDTFRPKVAQASIEAGANCINDVYAFSGPDASLPASEEIRREMKRLSRQNCVPVILMHSRGDAGSNKDYSMYSAGRTGQPVVEGIRQELGDKVDKIVRGKDGVRRWLVIADPGLGFSKTLDGNIEVLRNASAITADVYIGENHNRRRNALSGFPLLMGPSRKSFLGDVLERGKEGRKTTPKERDWATASTVACAVQQGALIVRVHEVREMKDVVDVALAIWRP